MKSINTWALERSRNAASASLPLGRHEGYPVLLAMLGDGRAHLSGIGKLAPHLTELCAGVLARAAHESKRQIEELVAELVPKPDVPPRGISVDVMAAVASPAETNVVVLNRVSWRTYESLLEDFADRGSPRLTYNRGTLEITSPTQRHEKLNRILALLVDTACEELGMDIESLGSTTFRRRELDRGFEPDSCFYFAKAELVRSKERLDLSVDPPPELVIEIDITTSSVPKDEIYASLGVLEVWRYDGNAVRIGRLQGKKYVESEASAVIPVLTADTLSQFVEMSKTATRPKLLRAFREWLASRR